MISCHCNSPFNPIHSEHSQCKFKCGIFTCKLYIRDVFLCGSGHAVCRRKGETQKVKPRTHARPWPWATMALCQASAARAVLNLWIEPATSGLLLPLKISANKPNQWVFSFIRKEHFKSRTLLLLDTKHVLSLPAVTLVTVPCLSFAGITFIFIPY